MSRWSRGKKIAGLVMAILVAVVLPPTLRLLAWRPAVVVAPPTDGLARVVVGLHLHTTASDGSGSFDEVVAAGRAAGLDVLVITDHNTFEHREREGYHDGLLVLVGVEVGTERGHLLSLGSEPPPWPSCYEAAGAIEDVRDGGGIAIVAHAFHRHGMRWQADDELAEVDGIEIINLDAAWRQRLRPVTLAAGLLSYPFAPVAAMTAMATHEHDALALHERLGESKPVVGLASGDVHGWPLRYKDALAVLVNVVLLDAPLTGRVDDDRAAVLAALRDRRVVVGYPAMGDPRAVSFTATAAGITVSTGGVLGPEGPTELRFATGIDRDADLRILRDGVVVGRTSGRELAVTVDAPGIYRGEAWLGGPFEAPWVLTNAIYLPGPEETSPAALSTPALSSHSQAEPLLLIATPEVEHDPGSSDERTLGFGGDLVTTLEVEHDRGSTGDLGIGFDGALVVNLGVGIQTAPGLESWSALIDRTTRDLSQYENLVVTGRSLTGAVRVDAAFTTNDGGIERRFRRSLRFDEDYVTHRLPLASFTDATGDPGVAPDPGRVVNVLITLDLGNAFPGTETQLWIKELFFE